MRILVDVGGSGVKIKRYENGTFSSQMRSFKPGSRKDFYSCISEMAEGGKSSHIEGIAVSVCGEYDYGSQKVMTCWHYPFLIGKLRDDLEREFKCCNAHVVNDGDAHALALGAIYSKRGLPRPTSAVNLSFGTAVGFGLLDWKGELLHSCQGHNWEVGNWQCDTRESTKDLYWVLGSEGLKSLEKKYGRPDAYVYFGQRICHFLIHDLVPLFHPKFIGLSGGIIADHMADIKEGIRRECEEKGHRNHGGPLDGVELFLSHERDSVMLGLAELSDRK